MFTKIANSKRGKFTALLLAGVMLFSSFTAPAGNVVVLKAGTVINLELIDRVTSDMRIGETVDFRVTNDVKAGGIVVIPAGSVAKGQISSISKNKIFGSAGEVSVQVKSVSAIDGTRVALSGSTLTAEGKSKLAVSLTLTLFCLLGFLIKGGDGEIIPGTMFSAIVANDTDIALPQGIFGHSQNMGSVDTTIPAGESNVVVTRDNPGASALEKTIIRWYFDSEPRGARVFWRVVSSIPAQVKNTNESYLGTTPFEETRAFNILGLTYENSRDVQIEVKIQKSGYMEQTKRFNVRQAIDQMEISSFYELVPRD